MRITNTTLISTAILAAAQVNAEQESGSSITTASYSYSIPIDLSVIYSNLKTATDSRLVYLVSEFEEAKGTSALISLASVYGSDFLKGTLTDITSLAQQVATVSGKNDEKNSVVTAETVSKISSAAIAEASAPSSSNTSSSSGVLTDNSAPSSASISDSQTNGSTIFTSVHFGAGNSTNTTSTSKAGADKANLYSYGTFGMICAGLLTLL